MSDEVKNTFGTYLGSDYQQKVLWQLLVEPEFCQNVIETIEVDYFDDPYLKRLFVMMLQYFKENNKVPNLQNESIYTAIHKYKSQTNEIEGEVLKGKVDQIKLWNDRVVNKNLLYDGDIVRNETINFVKQQEYRKLAEHIVSKVKTGDIRKSEFNFEVEEKINKIYHIGDDEDYGSDVIDDIDNALSKQFRQTIPTGIQAIDAVTGNGLGRGEIGLILAPSGVGKTTALTKIANTAFNDGKKVLQIIFEDTVPQVQRKHFALWSKIKLSEMDENTETVKARVLEHVRKKKMEGGKIDIVKFDEEDTSLHTIKNWIERQYKKFGYRYDMIVLDYLDCLEPNRRERDLHAAELSIVKSFIGMAAEYDIPCWSAIQTNRGGFDIDFVEAHHTGGNIKRVQKSHFVMSLSKPDKTVAIANIKIIKARFAQDGHEFKNCIFDNDTLEIRVTDSKYLMGLDVKQVDDQDLQKIEEKTLKLSQTSDIHAKINANLENKDFDKKPEDNPVDVEDEVANDAVNEGVSDAVNTEPKTVENVIKTDPEPEVKTSYTENIKIESNNSDVNKCVDFLQQMREQQGNIIKEE